MRIFFSAGEASGDAYAGALAIAVQQLNPNASFEGVGGKALLEAGGNLIADSRRWGAVGILESVKVSPIIIAGYLRTRSALRKGKPGVFVPIDFGFLNIKLAKLAKQLGWKVLYFVPPGSWRREKQGADLPKVSDEIITPFSWSKDILDRMGANVHYFGHPILSMIPKDSVVERSTDKVAIMPGSRMHEITANLDVIIQSAKLAGITTLELVIAPTLTESVLDQILAKCDLTGMTLTTTRDRYQALREGRIAILCSGTATLEAALCGCPSIIMYRGSKMAELEYNIRKPKFEFIGLPNLILRRAVMPELILNDANPERIARLARDLLPDGPIRQAQLDAFAELRGSLMPDDCIQQSARRIVALGA